jgi:hypothetical protein
MFNNFRFIFFPNKINKYIAWSINFLLFVIYKELKLENSLNNYITNTFDNNENNFILIIYYIKLIGIIFFYYKFFINYKVLFTKN